MSTKNAILFAIPALIWGSTWYVIKFQIGPVDPLFSVSYRFIIAAAILIVYGKSQHLYFGFSLKQHFIIFLQGACLFGFNYWLVYLAEEYLTSGLVALIFSGLIFLNIFFGAIFLGMPVKRKVLIGAFIGLIGMFLIFSKEIGAFQFTNKNFVSFLLALCSVVLASLGNILSAFMQKNNMQLIQTNGLGMLYGAVCLFLIGITTGAELSIDFRIPYMLSLIYLAIFGSIIAFTAYLKLLGNIGPDRSGYISLVMPVIAMLFSTVFEDFQWRFESLTGVLLILGGIFVVLRKPRSNVHSEKNNSLNQ